jgi:nucleoside-diphosphate-sugar epimerase
MGIFNRSGINRVMVSLGLAKAQNVLLVGGAGYIGSALLPMFLGKGCRVRLLD